MATKDEQRLTPYSSKEGISIKKWLNLYEIVCDAFKLTTDKAKITRLMAYLKEDALEFFSDDIAPDRNTLTWDEVREKFELRFGSGEIEPVVTATHRRLRREETIKQYFDSKLPILRKTGLPVNGMCALLTEGLPMSYKSHFYGRRFNDTLEWLRLASDIEADITSQQLRYSYDSRKQTEAHTFMSQPYNQNKPLGQQSKRFNSNEKPPYPCRYCQALGQTVFHWHRECPTRQSNTSQNNSTHNADSVGEPLLRSQRSDLTDPQTPSSTVFHSTAAEDKQCNGIILNHIKTDQNPTHVDIVVNINNVRIPAFVDTGSTHSFISTELAKQLKLEPKSNTELSVTQVNGSFRSKGSTETQIRIANRTESVSLQIVDGFRYPLLIGLDIGKQFGLTIDLNNWTAIVSNKESESTLSSQQTTPKTIAFTSHMEVTPHNDSKEKTNPLSTPKRKSKGSQSLESLPQKEKSTPRPHHNSCLEGTVRSTQPKTQIKRQNKPKRKTNQSKRLVHSNHNTSDQTVVWRKPELIPQQHLDLSHNKQWLTPPRNRFKAHRNLFQRNKFKHPEENEPKSLNTSKL